MLPSYSLLLSQFTSSGSQNTKPSLNPSKILEPLGRIGLPSHDYKSSVITFILKRHKRIFTLSIGVQKILKVSPFIKNENHLLFFVPELKLKIAVRFSICFSTVGKEGVEPSCISAMAFGTIVSTNSTTCPF